LLSKAGALYAEQRGRVTMVVADLMSTKLMAARTFELPHNVAERMKEARVRHMPVVDEDGELLGIISDRDLLRALEREREPLLRDVMTRHTTYVKPDTPAERALAALLELKIGALPVLEDNELVGIITETDFMKVAKRAIQWLRMQGQLG
jgi:CBS domain-containing membrane protein